MHTNILNGSVSHNVTVSLACVTFSSNCTFTLLLNLNLKIYNIPNPPLQQWRLYVAELTEHLLSRFSYW